MKSLKVCLLILLASVLTVGNVWAKNLAGYVIVSVGNVTAVDMESDQSRKLKRRSKIYEGDEIRTASGAKSQLKFKDKGVIALKENTALQITEFQYTGHEGAPEKSFFKLVKGGFRAISGAIGKQNQDDYKMETPLATIGIRGTHYVADLSKKLGVSVHSGAVEVRNAKGSVTIGDGFNFRNAVVGSVNGIPTGSMNPVILSKANEGVASDSQDSDENANEESSDLDDGKVIETLEQAQEENGQRPHDPEPDPEKVAEEQEEDEEEETKGSDGSAEASVSHMEEVFIELVEKNEKIEVGEGGVSLDDMVAVAEKAEEKFETIQEAESDLAEENDRFTPGDRVDQTDTDSGTGSDFSDARLSVLEESQLGTHLGLATVSKAPDSTDPTGEMFAGYATDASTGVSPIFVDRGAPPSDTGYDSLPIDVVLRQGSHTNSQAAAARFDASVDTSASGFTWGQWSGGVAELQTDSTDAAVFTQVTEPIYWYTAQASNPTNMPTSGEVRFDQTFLLAGQGSAGPIIEDDRASISIGFTLDWMNMTFSDGEIKIKNGVNGDPSQQQRWTFFDLSGSLVDQNSNNTPFLEFSDPPTGELCIGLCSVTSNAEGEIRAFVLDGEQQIAGNFTFWEQGNPAEWVTGIFAVGEEERYTNADSQNLDHGFFGVYQRSTSDGTGVTTVALLKGKSEAPISGDFLMVDQVEPNYGAVIRLGSGLVESTNPGGSASIHGHAVTWGAWNGSSADTHFTGNPAIETDKYTWISYSPVDPATMDALSSEVSFSLPYSFYGWQYDSGSGLDVPLEIDRGFVNVDLAADTVSGSFIFNGTGRFDVSFSGSTVGDGLTIDTSSAYFNGAPIVLTVNGQYVGSSFADGLAGAFNLSDPGDPNFYATGVFGFGRDERVTPTQIENMLFTGFMSIDQADAGNPIVEGGIATQPTSGIFAFRTFDPGNSHVLNPIPSTPMFSSAMLGSMPVDWGTWDDVSGSASQQSDPLDSSSSTTITDPISWVVSTPSDPTDIPTTGVTAYNTIVGFTGYSNGMPLDTPTTGDITMSVNFANQDFVATMDVTASVDSWSMNYTGSLSGSKLSGTGTGTYNGSQAASGVLDGVLVGTGATTTPGSGPEGVIGAFKNHVDADHTIHSSGVFVLGQ